MAINRINAFPAWQERVRNPLASGDWVLGNGKVRTAEGKPVNPLADVRGPLGDPLQRLLRTAGVIDDAEIAAVRAARDAERSAKASPPVSDEMARMRAAFGVRTPDAVAAPAPGRVRPAVASNAAAPAAANAAQAGSRMLLPFPDGDPNLVSPLRDLHVQLGVEPIAQSQFDTLMATKRTAAVQEAAAAVLEAFTALGRHAR